MDNPKTNMKPPILPEIEMIPRSPLRNIDLAALFREQREREVVDLGFAHVMFERLREQIKDFEESLEPNEEVGAYLSSFGAKTLILIDNIGYHNPYFIIFNGVNAEDGCRVRLVQHTSQISVLFTVVKVNDDRKPRRIGFFIDKPEQPAEVGE